MQLAILNGVYGEIGPDLRRSYPVNFTPVANDTGISKGYLRTSAGVTKTTDLTGADRGGIVWNGAHYRVIGTQLVKVSAAGAVTAIGDVGAGGRASFAYSFDRLAVASGGKLFYLKNNTLTRVTDADLGQANDVIWVDGYFMTTDGTSLVVTELNDPTAVDPLKYGSSEADPDPIVGLLELRGEVFALNANTIEVFQNSGSTGFPFRRSRGAQIPKGCVGSKAFARFVETFAFCGSGRNEPPAVYLAGAGQGIKISPSELDLELGKLSPTQLATVLVEGLNGGGYTQLLVHLPTETWVYHWSVSQQFDFPVWTRLAGGKLCDRPYAPRGFVLSENKWWCGSATALGYVDDTTTDQLGVPAGALFDVGLLYNNGEGAIVYALELVSMAGRAALNQEPYMFMSYSDDALTYSREQACGLGGRGDRAARPSWRKQGRVKHWRSYRFRQLPGPPLSFIRLEAQVEPLSHA